MKTNKNTSAVRIGLRVRVLNKFGDEVADGFITDIERDGFTLSTGEAVLWRHILTVDASEVTLSVAS
jgi:hypothetical protein